MTTKSEDNATKNESDADDFKLLYAPLEDVEPLERYSSGGYHPACIGDRLHSRYEIVHKLGFGTFSTTWLARDDLTKTYVAIKIAVARTDHPPESDMLRYLHSCSGSHPGQHVLPSILDEFEIVGPNGTHSCLVRTPARMCIAESREASVKRIFQLPVARAIALQLVQAIAFMHSRGVVHSDLHEGNIMLRLPKTLDSMTPSQIYDKYGQPDLEQIQRVDGQSLGDSAPTHGVVPMWMGEGSENLTLNESEVLLNDFGESFRASEATRYYTNTPFILRPPESFFGVSEPLSFSADIWSLACAIFAILGQRPLFESWFPSRDQIIVEHVDALGRLPPEWWSQWEKRGEHFNEQLVRADGESRRSLEDRFEYSVQEPRRKYGMDEVDEEETKALLALLKSMLAFRPEDRPSAQDVLSSEWATKWATPDFASITTERAS